MTLFFTSEEINMEHRDHNTLARLAGPLIIIATVIWGSSFVVMKDSVSALPPMWLLAIRFTLAGLLLGLFCWKRWNLLDSRYLLGGAVMGFFLCLAYVFQTFGLTYTTPGKNAFFTAVYCVAVPFLNWAVSRRRPDRFNVIAALLCLTGVGLVSVTGADAASAFNVGDVLTLIGGLLFAAHILAVDRFAEGRDIFLLTALQFLFFALFAWIGVLVTRPALDVSVFNGPLIARLMYLVVIASCGALLFQNIGQKYTPPAKAAVLLALEAPFGVIFSVALSGERPTALAILGFGLIFLAVVCSETKFAFLCRPKAENTP